MTLDGGQRTLQPKQIAQGNPTMALTQADLDALDATIASGTLTATYNGRTVTFQFTAE